MTVMFNRFTNPTYAQKVYRCAELFRNHLNTIKKEMEESVKKAVVDPPIDNYHFKN